MRHNKVSRAERFWKAEDARWVRISTPVGHVREVVRPFPASRLMDVNVECCADAAIKEAIVAGQLNGPFEAIRTDLAVVCAMAWGTAGAIYAEQLAAPDRCDRQAKAGRLAAELRAFLAGLEAEADTADKWESEADATDLDAMLKHGRELTPLLEAYARPLPTEHSAPATDHVQREFFTALRDWWADHAIDPERRGARAIRNRLALGLWQDMEQVIPEGYSGDDFAQRGFRNG